MTSAPDGHSSVTLPGVELVEQIGRGGFATVYRGWQPAFNRAVAVKVLDRPDGSSSARFKKEVRALGSLSGHPHVVAVYEAGTVGDRRYLVMPFLSGGHLEDRLRAHPLEPRAAVAIMADIAGAVATAHGLGILHRDIKPANILFTSYGEPQLADFGIARLTDATLTTEGLIAATVTYAAPEVLGGAIATEAADIYSLGATLYAALRGAPPFEPRPGEAPIVFALRVFNEPAPDLQSAGVPAALAAVVAKAMAKQPADRYRSAQAFRDALLGVDLPASAFTPPPPPPPPPRLPQVVRPERLRRPKRAAAVAAALAVLVGGGTAAAMELSGNSRSAKVAQKGPTTTVPTPPTASRTSAPRRAPPRRAPPRRAPPRRAPPGRAPPRRAPPLPRRCILQRPSPVPNLR